MKDDRAGSSGGSADSGGAPSSGASGSGASSSGASPADSSEHLPPEDNATSSEGADRPAEPDSADHPAEVDLVERSADDDPTAEPGEGWAGVEENRLSGDPTAERDEGWAGLEENPLSDGPNAVADDSGGYGAERELTGKERMVAEYREALAEAEIQDEPAASGPVYEASEFGDDAVWDPAAAVDRDDADLIPGSKADEEDLILDAASVAYPKTPRHPCPSKSTPWIPYRVKEATRAEAHRPSRRSDTAPPQRLHSSWLAALSSTTAEATRRPRRLSRRHRP